MTVYNSNILNLFVFIPHMFTTWDPDMPIFPPIKTSWKFFVLSLNKQKHFPFLKPEFFSFHIKPSIKIFEGLQLSSHIVKE
jgi:hypothetical protein